jgi:hypothetical protein
VEERGGLQCLLNKRFGEAQEITCAIVPLHPYKAFNVLDGCRRCGGFLVDDHMDLDIEERRTGSHCWAMRCVQCGDMIDETILRNPSLVNDRGEKAELDNEETLSIIYSGMKATSKRASTTVISFACSKGKCDLSCVIENFTEFELHS